MQHPTFFISPHQFMCPLHFKETLKKYIIFHKIMCQKPYVPISTIKKKNYQQFVLYDSILLICKRNKIFCINVNAFLTNGLGLYSYFVGNQNMLKSLNSLIDIYLMFYWAIESANQPPIININIFKLPVKVHALQSIKIKCSFKKCEN